MSFAVAADAYDQFMGRFASPLAPKFADFAGVRSGQRVLDVGCGPGALTGELVQRVGALHVAAVEPSQSFFDAVRARQPDVDVRCASAEDLPFPDGAFDAALAQLVVHFMKDPLAGLREMRRVSSGVVAACVWDHGIGPGPLTLFWDAARELDPTVHDESQLPGAIEGDLARLFNEAGLHDVEDGVIEVTIELATFDQWWGPFTLGVGPAGAHVASLDDATREQLREHCRARISGEPFQITARAWAARGRA